MLQNSTTTAYAVQSTALAEFLETAAIGEVITYDQMNRHLGINVQSHRYILNRAFEALITKGIRFDSIYRQGYKRMNLEDTIGATDRAIGKVRRTARKARERAEMQMQCANDIDEKTRRDLNNRMSLLGVLEHLARPATVKEIEKVSDDRIIPFGRVLEAMRQ